MIGPPEAPEVRGCQVLVFVLFKREAKSLAKMLQSEGAQEVAWAKLEFPL